MTTATIEKPAKPTGKAPYYVKGWWTVDLDNGRCLGFETRAKAERFMRENRAAQAA